MDVLARKMRGAALPASLWWTMAASVLLRVAAACYFGDTATAMPGVADQVSYHTLAGRVLGGHGFTFAEGWWPATRPGEPTAHWSYLYVLYLTAVYAAVGVHPIVARLIQAVVVGVLQPYLTWRVARRAFGPAAAVAAAMIAAGYIYFIYYGGALMTESFYMVAILWGIDTAGRIAEERDESRRTRVWPWVGLGAAFAVTVLLRQAYVFMLPLIMLWLAAQLWTRGRGAGEGLAAVLRHYVPRAVVTALVVVAAIAPWTARNYRAFGRFVPLNTNAGFAFFWGNHPVHGHGFLPLLPDDGPGYYELIPESLRALDEAALDQALLSRGVGFVVDEPRRFVHMSAGRVVEYFKFWPTADSGWVSNASRVLSFGLIAPFMCAGIALMFGGGRFAAAVADRPAAALLLLVAAAYSLMHVVTWALVRYRLPVDALLMPCAGLAMATLMEWARTAPWSSRVHPQSIS